jgi:hypothetical protein
MNTHGKFREIAQHDKEADTIVQESPKSIDLQPEVAIVPVSRSPSPSTIGTEGLAAMGQNLSIPSVLQLQGTPGDAFTGVDGHVSAGGVNTNPSGAAKRTELFLGLCELAWIESKRLERIIAENRSTDSKHLIAWPIAGDLENSPIDKRAEISGSPFMINGYPGGVCDREHWTWWPVETLTADDIDEFEEYTGLLWPEIGNHCTVHLECKVMRTILVQSSSGFWIVDFSLEWAAFIAPSWDEALPCITEYKLWDKATFKSPTEAAIAAVNEAECRRANRPLSECEQADFDAMMAGLRGMGGSRVS